MTKTLGFGLIGASTISREWMIDAIRAQPDAEVVAVFSREMARARAFADEFGIPHAHDTLQAMLAEPGVDAVYIASTNERHHAEVLACAAAGKHVLCDKPLTLSVEQGMDMVEACRTAGVTFATNHHMRNGAPHRAMQEAVASGRIGKPVTMRIAHGAFLPPHLQTWRITDAAAGAGAILDLSVHDADLARFLLDDEIVAVSAMATGSGMGASGIEDTAIALLRMAKGTLIQFQDVFNTPYNRGSVEIHGSDGSLFARDIMTQKAQGEVSLRDKDGDHVLPLAHENLYVRGVGRFIAATRGDDAVPSSGLDGVKSLAVALAMLESAKTGREVAVAALG